MNPGSSMSLFDVKKLDFQNAKKPFDHCDRWEVMSDRFVMYQYGLDSDVRQTVSLLFGHQQLDSMKYLEERDYRRS
ncbi:unnamed protein product [Gongylonema pulchrum]|uniref:Integrase n=1 Tax=Gongylonema pulchrum TaxID=637853 RepID=A0A183DUD3_9BILA|nr:unnamed protein product [Gongylonema pulchrum]